MRLDHLLSRETAEAEMRKLIPRSMRERVEETHYSLVKEAAQAAKHENASANAGEQVAQDAQRRRGITVRRERFESLYRLQGSSPGR